jgi:outer membrane protein, heavy metal efflux system
MRKEPSAVWSSRGLQRRVGDLAARHGCRGLGTVLLTAVVSGTAFGQPVPGLAGGAAQPAPAQPPGVVQPAPAAEQAVPLADLLVRAEAVFPSLVAARQARRQAEFRAVAAGALPAVTLNVGAHLGQGASGDDQDIMVSGRLELGGKRRLRAEEARREVEAARAREAQARTELRFQVRSTFADLRAAAAEERLARENLDLAQTFLRLAEAQFAAGDVPQTNVLRAQIEVENAAQAVTAAAAVTAARRATLNVFIGATPDAPLEVPEAALTPAVPLDLPTLRELAQSRPDLRAAAATLRAREAAVGVARSARRPDLTADAAHASLDDLSGNVLRVGLAFPVFDFGVTRANTRVAQAAAGEQRANLDLLRRQAAQEVETAYRNLLAARQQAERLGGPQLERVRRLRDLAELGYREGEFSYLELLDAQRAYQATFAQYLRAVAAASSAEAALERAVGGSLVPTTPGAGTGEPKGGR